MILTYAVLVLFILCVSYCEKVFHTDHSVKTDAHGRPLTRVVTTKYGALRGFVSTLPNSNLKPVEVYLGVPYASPPTSALRFMPPVTPAHWQGVRPVLNFSPVCPQKLPDISNETEALTRMPYGRLQYLKRLLVHLRNQSEDCLYLNLYTPQYGGRDSPKVPVMVFIHGESYEWNAGNPYDGSVLASFGNVIIVTVNYRLGVLGFLPAAEGSARGNYGLMDQFAALHWIQENIAEFGGDPTNVTVFGQGHGAACVNFLVLSPMAKGLFHRAIMQSGSALSSWAVSRDAPVYAEQLARTLGCPDTQSSSFLECMRQRSANDILKVELQVPDFSAGFGPTVDGIVIEDEPEVLLKKLSEERTGDRFELIFGVTRVESYFRISSHEERYGIDTNRRDSMLRTLVKNIYTNHLQEIFLTILNEYTDWTKPLQHAMNVLDSTLDAIGDASTVAPTIKTANYHSKGFHRTYFYVFGYQTEGGDFPQRQGCIHGEDLHYVFGAPLVGNLSQYSHNYSRAEVTLSEAVMTSWVNFARNGDPNSVTQDVDPTSERTKGRYDKITWPAYEVIHQKYLIIGMKPKVRDHYHAHRLSFWLHLFPQFRSTGMLSRKPETKVPDHREGVQRHDTLHRRHQSTELSATKDNQIAGAPLRPSSDNERDRTRHSSNAQKGSLNPNEDVVNGQVLTSPNITGAFASTVSHSTFSTALSVTIVVGCALLLLNILIFAGIYHQWERNRSDDKDDDEDRKFPAQGDSQAISCSASQMKQMLLRAPPPSPATQSMQQHEMAVNIPLSHHLHQYSDSKSLPPKVPPKPSVVQTSSEAPMREAGVAETQPLLSEHKVAGSNLNCAQCGQSQANLSDHQHEMRL